MQDNGLTLQFASEALRNDEVVFAAVEEMEWLWVASEDTQFNVDVVFKAVTTNGEALRFPSELRNDREVVLAAVVRMERRWSLLRKDAGDRKSSSLQ